MSQTKAQLLNPLGEFELTGQLVGVGATFSGNVSIAGTLTKQDVTNVDSVGVITARSGVDITGASAGVNGSSNLILKTGGSERARIDSNGDINLGNNPTNQYGYKLNIQDSSILYAQTASSGGTELKLHLDNSTDLATFGTVSSDNLVLVTNNLERLRITSQGSVGIGSYSPVGTLDVTTTAGAGSTVFIYAANHDASSISQAELRFGFAHSGSPVSYTHLTLPTIYSV